jgi:hypothetical protein
MCSSFFLRPGCSGGSSDGSRSDYCIYTQQQDNNNKYENENLADVNLRAYGSSPHVSRLPLGRCEGGKYFHMPYFSWNACAASLNFPPLYQ